MKRKSLIFLFISFVIAMIIMAVLVLKSDKALLIHPKGIIASKELKLITTSYLLMSIIVIPTFVFLFIIAWKYRAQNKKAQYKPEREHPFWHEILLWMIPTVIIAPMAVITWYASHELDPYQPIQSTVRPLSIQVVALDWKWLFIYPEQGIATVNFFQFPENTPIHLSLSADGSPMNSFWLPELSGQIYAMSGMVTPLHIMADGEGVYSGRAAELNGRGLADMTFTAKSSTESDFLAWVKKIKKSSLPLTHATYKELVWPSSHHPITFYSHIEEGLFQKIIDSYTQPL